MTEDEHMLASLALWERVELLSNRLNDAALVIQDIHAVVEATASMVCGNDPAKRDALIAKVAEFKAFFMNAGGNGNTTPVSEPESVAKTG